MAALVTGAGKRLGRAIRALVHQPGDHLLAGARRRAYANGFLNAIEASGALLATHFPKSQTDTNELDDHVVEL